jgi:monofunctional glycosyltransferase
VLKLLKYLIIVLFLTVLCGTAFYCVYPDISKLKKQNPKKTAFMEYREREWKAKGRKVRISQKWIPYNQISPYLVKAVLIAEDDKFWKHDGFDYDAIEKAVERDLKTGKFKLGASTISQQLVKNLYLSPSKNPIRKLKEAIITWRLEKTLSKRRILELYLNVIEWGEGIFGVEAASHRYFGESASQLSPEEAARLAAVLPNPRKYQATGNSRFVQRRAALLYNIMVRRHIVVPTYEEAEKEAPPSEDRPFAGPLQPASPDPR